MILRALAPTRRVRNLSARLVLAQLERITRGKLAVHQDGATHRFGDGEAPIGLRASLSVHDDRVWRRILLGGALGAAEAYLDGDWSADDVTTVVRILLRNRRALDGLEGGVGQVRRAAAALYHVGRRNTVRGSHRNIFEHYDLGNDFFALMLDPTMTYSSAIFEPGDTLEQASRRKLDLLCRKLDLSPRDHLLEIGTGWGSLAIHAATRYGCRVTTTTISRAQRELALARVHAAGLADRVEILTRDYRDLDGTYDKVVSCEMIEAVGAEFLGTFFATCAARLVPGGKLALQAITIADQEYERARREADFIKRHIFPGSCIPSVTALCQAATAASDLRLTALSDHTADYARTLAAWRDNLAPHEAPVTARFGARFWRSWHFYLGYCEAGFTERYIGGAQLVFQRP